MAKTKTGNVARGDDKYKRDVAQEAIRIVLEERSRWEDAVCYVTEKIGFRMREMIRTFRKNFWGIFDKPTDVQTGRDKTWIPLAMKVVEDCVKNINMGQKDINFRAKRPTKEAVASTATTRAIVRDYLDKMNFGEVMDEMDRQLCIDGTVVWKTWESTENGKVKVNRETVDLLNLYIDPTEKDIQSAYRFTERSLLLPDQIKAMDWYDISGDIKGSQTISRNDAKQNAGGYTITTGNFTDVWEMWGKIPKWIITGDKKAEDAYSEIDGHIIISGVDSDGVRVHLIEENKKKDATGNIIKPYEECRDAKITGRWYGLGKIERILALITYMNTTVNIRISRNIVSQLGLFKIRKGSGITPAMIAKLPVNGAIEVTQADDITQMPVQEMGATSYKDEEVIKDWATAITGAYPISAGGDVPASQTATTSVLQNTNAKSSFNLTKEAKGFFLKRWMDRHALPIIAKTVKKGELIRYAGDEENLKIVVERAVSNEANERLSEDYYAKGFIPSEFEVMNAMQQAHEKLMKDDGFFIELMDDLVAEHVDTHIYFNNEDLDTAVTVQNIMSLIPLAPELREGLVTQVFDLLGLDKPRATPQPQAPQEMPQGMPQDLATQGIEANVI